MSKPKKRKLNSAGLGCCDKFECRNSAVTVEKEAGARAGIATPSKLCAKHARKPGVKGTWERPKLVRP